MKKEDTPKSPSGEQPPMQAWVIWSEEHAAWWGPGKWGYTKSLASAGRYSQAEAQAICTQANFDSQAGGGTWQECAFPLASVLS